MRTMIVICALLGAAAVSGQDAKVELLTPQETAQAKQAYDNLQKAQADLGKLKDAIRLAHLTTGAKDFDAGNCASAFTQTLSQRIKSGWGCGEFDFSSDFKAIVPHVEATPKTYCGNDWGAITTSP